MQLVLTAKPLKRLERELKRGGRREIGGLLMGEHIGGEKFRLADFTVQHDGGSHSHFLRDPAQHKEQLDSFFARTGHDYGRFNYLGEWHSHPSFEPLPSSTDMASMQQLVEDPATNVNFLVLLIVRRSSGRRLDFSALAFRPGHAPLPVEVESEGDNIGADVPTWCGWLRRLINR